MEKHFSSSTGRLLAAVGLCVFFSALCVCAALWIGIPNRSTPLWALSTIQLLPITALGLLFSKLNDVPEIGGVSRDERRRLEAIIKKRVRLVIALIAFHIAAGLILGILLYGAQFGRPTVPFAFGFAGALVGLSIFFTISAYIDYAHIAHFKAAIVNRSRDTTARAELLKKMLAPSSADKPS